MREWEITYVKRGDEPPEGEHIPWPDKCHHARYVSGIVVRELWSDDPCICVLNGTGPEGCGVCNGTGRKPLPVEPERCPFCFNPKQELEVHGHIECIHCHQVVSTCCPGSGEGESG